MASAGGVEIKVVRTPIQVVNRLSLGRRDSGLLVEESTRRGVFSSISFMQYHPDFGNVIGKEARHALLLSSTESSHNPFFYAGCAHVLEPIASGADSRGGIIPEEEVVYTTSNLLQTANSAQLPVILISRIAIQRNPSTGDVTGVEWAKLRPPSNMPMPAGAIPYRMAGMSSGVLYCAQGNPSPSTSGLFYMPRGKPPQPLVTNYYGRDFNSVHDVARHPEDGSLWFTDPSFGFERDFRKKPQMPCHVYRLDTGTGDLRVVADNLRRPTGICFGNDIGAATTLYVSDTDALHGDGNQDPTRPATIYAFDIVRRNGSDFLANKRVFAYAVRGPPMAVRCDNAGNVYAACADGVEVWNAGGVLLGVIEVPGGVTSFCFPREGELILCSQTRLWWVHAKARIEVSRWGSAGVPMTVDPDDNYI